METILLTLTELATTDPVATLVPIVIMVLTIVSGCILAAIERWHGD